MVLRIKIKYTAKGQARVPCYAQKGYKLRIPPREKRGLAFKIFDWLRSSMRVSLARRRYQYAYAPCSTCLLKLKIKKKFVKLRYFVSPCSSSVPCPERLR